MYADIIIIIVSKYKFYFILFFTIMYEYTSYLFNFRLLILATVCKNT